MDALLNPMDDRRPDAPLHVLVVEDMAVFRRSIQQALTGHRVSFATCAEEAIERYKDSLPDMVLLDIGLPDEDGFSVLQRIRQTDPTAYIVMLTGSNLKDDVKKAVEAGANGYVIKPFTRGKLQEYIAKYNAHHEQFPSSGFRHKSAPPPASSVSESGAGERAGNPEGLSDAERAHQERRESLRQELRILFADHHKDNRNGFQYALRDQSLQVITSDTPDDIAEKLESEHFHLVFLDCEMPEMDGYRLASRIRQRDREQRTHRFIVGLGHLPKSPDNKRWRQAGMNAYFQKPVPIDKIAQFITCHLEDFFTPYAH